MLQTKKILDKIGFDTTENETRQVRFKTRPCEPRFGILSLLDADEILLPVRHPDLVADPLLLEGLAQELPHDRVLHVLVLLKRLPGVLLDEKPVIIYYTRSDEVF